jgi:hypothetical protein
MHFATLIIFVTAATAATIHHKRDDVDVDDPQSLSHCGNDAGCHFEAIYDTDKINVDHIVGHPVENCMGGTTNTTTTIGGSVTVSQTFKYSVSVGVSGNGGEEFPVGLSLENSETWSSTESRTFSQSFQMTIAPGYKASDSTTSSAAPS